MSINTFNAFKNRNYRLYFGGQSLSLIGTWMQKTAVTWLVYSMTHSAFMLGVTVFATQFPMFLFSLLGGIASDRYDRYKVLLLTQVLSMVQAAVLTIFTFTNHYTVWEILTFSVILGTINAFDVPARQPMVHEMISDKADLPNALALNSSMVNLAKLLGPALSGIMLERFGAGACFLINTISFLAVIISLLRMKLPEYVPATEKKEVIADLVEGFVYVKNTPVLRNILMMLTFTCLLILPYNTLLPIFAKVIFKGGAATFGYINSFIGLGAVCGAVFLASLKQGSDLKFILLVNTVILGIGLALFSHAKYFPVAMLFATISGFGTMSQTTICNTIVQVNSDKKMRGRVIGILLLALGVLPLGSLIVGAVSQKVGAQNTLLGEGILAVFVAAVFSRFLISDSVDKKRMELLKETE
jgi:MFS family permease